MRELEDPNELEDLQMIPSLADDVDEEFMEDVTLEEAEVQRLLSSCEERWKNAEERESSFACKTRTEGGENAFKALKVIPQYCIAHPYCA